MEKYGFVYIWFDRRRKMFYIGCHWGYEDDGYICSSNRMRDAYRRRPNDFKRRILVKNVEKQVLLIEEYKWLKLIKNEELGIKYYNYANSIFPNNIGRRHSKEVKEKLRDATLAQFSDPEKRERHRIAVIEAMTNLSPESREKLASQKGKKRSSETIEKTRQAHLGKKLSEETKRKIGEANKIALKGKTLPLEVIEKITAKTRGKKRSDEFKKRTSEIHKGMKHTEETKEKISLIKKELYSSVNSPMFGKKHTEETKKKISENRIGKCSGEQNPFFGKTHSDETKVKISEANKRRGKMSEEQKEKIRQSCLLTFKNKKGSATTPA